MPRYRIDVEVRGQQAFEVEAASMEAAIDKLYQLSADGITELGDPEWNEELGDVMNAHEVRDAGH